MKLSGLPFGLEAWCKNYAENTIALSWEKIGVIREIKNISEPEAWWTWEKVGKKHPGKADKA